MAWATVFDNLYLSDTWRLADAALEHGYARLSWANPNQTERYGLALVNAAGEIYGNQVVRASPQPQIIKLPAPTEFGQSFLAVRPWNLAAQSCPVTVAVDGTFESIDNTDLLAEIATLLEDIDLNGSILDSPISSVVSVGDQILVWQDGQLRRLQVAAVPAITPVPVGQQFNYASNGDQNDIFYWIGTNYGSAAWVNPVTTNRLIVTASLPSNGATALQSTTINPSNSNNDSYLYFGTTDSFIAWDLVSKRVQLKAYSIRIGNFSDAFLRTWRVQGSNDNTNWTDLDIQTNNLGFNGSNVWVTITNLTNPTPTVFRCIRIFMPGLSSTNNFTKHVRSFQIYGGVV